MPANPYWFRNVKESPSTNPNLKDGLFIEKVAPKSPGLDDAMVAICDLEADKNKQQAYAALENFRSYADRYTSEYTSLVLPGVSLSSCEPSTHSIALQINAPEGVNNTRVDLTDREARSPANYPSRIRKLHAHPIARRIENHIPSASNKHCKSRHFASDHFQGKGWHGVGEAVTSLIGLTDQRRCSANT